MYHIIANLPEKSENNTFLIEIVFNGLIFTIWFWKISKEQNRRASKIYLLIIYDDDAPPIPNWTKTKWNGDYPATKYNIHSAFTKATRGEGRGLFWGRTRQGIWLTTRIITIIFRCCGHTPSLQNAPTILPEPSFCDLYNVLGPSREGPAYSASSDLWSP